MGQFCFVVPRYGANIGGGAETLVRVLAEMLVEDGHKASVATTCAKDNRTWHNELSPGVSNENGVEIFRFKVNDRDLDKWLQVQFKINDNIIPSVDEQLDWISNGVNSYGLYKFIVESGHSFDALFFAPYLFPTTFFGSQIIPNKSVLIPCLHNEIYAYLDIVRVMFDKVAGSLFNAKEEMVLAKNLYGDIQGAEVGMCFNFEEYNLDAPSFFSDKERYIVYVGRKETGKNLHTLLNYFIKGKEKGDLSESLKLVVLGSGDFKDVGFNEDELPSYIIPLPYLSEEDKKRVIKGADLLCQPSFNESFSIVIMEAWLLGVPVLAHSKCDVIKEHIINSQGGLYFEDYLTFVESIKRVLSDDKLRRALALNGRAYVLQKYSKDKVKERLYKALDLIFTKEDLNSKRI